MSKKKNLFPWDRYTDEQITHTKNTFDELFKKYFPRDLWEGVEVVFSNETRERLLAVKRERKKNNVL